MNRSPTEFPNEAQPESQGVPCEALLPPRGDEPEFTIRLGPTKNPVAWLLSITRLVILAAVIVVLLWIGCFLGPLLLLFFIPAGLFGYLFSREVDRILLVDRSQYCFYADELRVHRRRWNARNRDESYPLDAVTEIGLPSLGELHLCLRHPTGQRIRSVLRLPAFQAEDIFDACVDHLLRHAPKSKFTIRQGAQTQISTNMTG